MIYDKSAFAADAFLACSSEHTLSRSVEDILSGCAFCDYSTLQVYLSEWSSRHGHCALPDILPVKQPFWDRPGVLADKAAVKSSLSSPPQSASFLTASSVFTA